MKDEFYCLLALGLCPALGQADVSDSINVHDGFEATLFAGPELADDIYSMTLDAKGRLGVPGLLQPAWPSATAAATISGVMNCLFMKRSARN